MAKVFEISTQGLNIMWGVSKMTIAKYAKDWLKPAKIRTGVFDAAMAHKLYLEHKILPKYAKPDDDSESMDQAKRRKEIAVANMKELLEQQMKGDLIQRDEAVKWVGALVDEAKMAFLALPRRMAPVIYGKDIREGEIILRAEVQRILARLAKARK